MEPEKPKNIDHLVNTLLNSIFEKATPEEATEALLWSAAIVGYADQWPDEKMVGRLAAAMWHCKKVMEVNRTLQ